MDNKTSIILSATDKTAAAFKSAQKNLDGLSGSMSKFNSLLAGVGLGVSAQTIGKMADDYSNLQSRLKLASRSTQEFAAANEAVQRIAAASQSPLLETATLYTRIAASLKDTAVSQEEMVGTTEAVALALRISGASAAEASSAMLQFSQAMASGVLRGEEFNAVNESAPRLMQALAKSLGVGVGALRDMAKAGQLTREVLINGLANELPTLRREAETLPKTFGAAFTELNNTLLLTIGRINETSRASGTLAQALTDIGKPAITTIFETLGVVGVNVAYVFRQVGNEIGGIAAQLSALAQFRFKDAGLIGDMMKRDAQVARKELDAIEARILGLSGKTQAAATSGASRSVASLKLPGVKGKSAKPKDRMSDTEWAMEETAHLTRTLYQLGEQMDEASTAAFERAAESAEAWQSGLDAANESLRQAAQGYVDLIDPVERYRRQLEEIRQLAEAGLLTKEQATEAEFAIQQQIDAAAGFGEELKKVASEMDIFLENAARGFQESLADFLFDPFADGLDGMLKGFGEMLRRMAAEAIAADITRAIFGNTGGTGGGQNILGGIAELFGYASGGAFTVGGAGGTDSKLVAFKATPGEQVIVRTPQQQRAASGGGIIVQMTVNTPDAASFRRSVGQIQADLAQAVSGARRYS